MRTVVTFLLILVVLVGGYYALSSDSDCCVLPYFGDDTQFGVEDPANVEDDLESVGGDLNGLMNEI